MSQSRNAVTSSGTRPARERARKEEPGFGGKRTSEFLLVLLSGSGQGRKGDLLGEEVERARVMRVQRRP